MRQWGCRETVSRGWGWLRAAGKPRRPSLGDWGSRGAGGPGSRGSGPWLKLAQANLFLVIHLQCLLCKPSSFIYSFSQIVVVTEAVCHRGGAGGCPLFALSGALNFIGCPCVCIASTKRPQCLGTCLRAKFGRQRCLLMVWCSVLAAPGSGVNQIHSLNGRASNPAPCQSPHSTFSSAPLSTAYAPIQLHTSYLFLVAVLSKRNKNGQSQTASPSHSFSQEEMSI